MDEEEPAGAGETTQPSSGVCRFSEPVELGPVGADGMLEVPPNHPNIWYMGRVDCTPDGPSFAFPAVSVRLRFTGSALDLRFRDFGTASTQSTNFYDVSIDGGEPTRLEMASGEQVLRLARDLTEGEHTAEIVKRVESNRNTGKGQVLGFAGAQLLPVQFREAYAELLRRIRRHYPAALLLAVVGPILNDDFPPQMLAWTTMQSDVSQVVGEMNVAGDSRVHYLALTPQTAPYGEDWHPTLATHQQMAQLVASELRSLLASP